MLNKKIDILDQYDFIDDEYLEKVEHKFAPLVGLFLIRFSALEHSINIAITELISSGSHETGYVVVERLTVDNKIELFYKLYLRPISFKDKKQQKVLNSIKSKLKILNSFRNSLVHANWLSLSKDGYLRSKIVIDNEGGDIIFKKIEITPKIIKEKIKKLELVIYILEEFQESALDFSN